MSDAPKTQRRRRRAEVPPAPAEETSTEAAPQVAIAEQRDMSDQMSALTGLPVATVRLSREDIDLIKATVGRDAKMTDSELMLFARMCESWQLNPFLREIWAIRYEEGKPISMFASRDGLLAVAQRHPEYTGPPVAFAVREADDFSIDVVGDDVKVIHRMGKPPRGALLGAWAKVSRRGKTPLIWWADFAECRKNTRFWNNNPEAAIITRAEAGGLKRQFGLSGLSVEDEPDPTAIDVTEQPQALPAPQTPTPEQIADCAAGLRRLNYTPAKVNQRMASVRTAQDAEMLLQSIRTAEETDRPRTASRVGRREEPAAPTPAPEAAPRPQAPAPEGKPQTPTLVDLLDGPGTQQEPGGRV